jgi:hypothetical protein
MEKIISLAFIYKSKVYYALIRTKKCEDKTGYYITIMNGDLEMMLYGNHIILETEGKLEPEQKIISTEVAHLKHCITEALLQSLQEKEFQFAK